MEIALKHMTGEQLLLLRVLGGEPVRPAIEAELDRRARLGIAVSRQRRPAGAAPAWAVGRPASRAA